MKSARLLAVYDADTQARAPTGRLSADIHRVLAACGIAADARQVSLGAFNSAAAEHGLSVEDRLRAKLALTQAGRLVP
jgi:hypothetical protein